MSEPRPVLFELGTEELPARSLGALKEAFAAAFTRELRGAGLVFAGPVEPFASARRLTVRVGEVAPATEASSKVRKGPQASAAFDAQGEPTPALLGFARSCQADEAQMKRWAAGEDRLKTDKGEWLSVTQRIDACSCQELLPEICGRAVAGLPLENRMRWGEGEESFLRPVRGVVLLYGEEVVAAEVLGVQSTRVSRGHRQLGAAECEIPSAQAYETCLRDEGRVWVVGRTEEVRCQIAELPLQEASVSFDEARLELSCAGVEYPVALCGKIDAEDMALPFEVIRTVLEEQQGYFPTCTDSGALSPHFVMVANQPDPAGAIIAGAEKVVRARLRDAAFYLERDRRRQLADRTDDLARVVWHRKMGTLFGRTQRLEVLVARLAEGLDFAQDPAVRAAHLCKADLGTDLVQSFPTLQGIAGGIYAREDGEEEAICAAIREHYLPRRAEDVLPASEGGQVLALADRLDMLAGVFCVQEAPSGTRDPLGVRRAAYGVLRLIVECELDLDLSDAVDAAVRGYPDALQRTEASAEVMQYLDDRMRGYGVEQGQDKDTIEAVLALRPNRPLDAWRRMQVVAELKGQPQMALIIGTHKRIRNILREAPEGSGELHEEALQEAEERALAQGLDAVREQVQEASAQGRYVAALTGLLELAQPVANFFDEVLVMADDAQIRHNRLCLLRQVQELFLCVADFSRLQD